jgi:integrase
MRVNIEDRWLRKSATAAARRALASARDPMRARVPEAMRTTEFGKGMRWRVTWYADRERRRRSFASRKDAEAFAASLEDDIRSGRYVDPRDLERTIGSAGEAGFALLVPVVKPATWNRYRRDWDTHVAPYWGNRPLSALTPSALGSWIASLADGSARSCHGVMLSTSSIRGIHRALSVAVDYAMSNGWLQSDPLKAVKWPRKGQSKRVYLTVAQVGRLADAAGVHGIDILLLAYTGMRIGEALALRVADVDLRRRRITVARTKTVGREGNAETVGPTKNGQVRRVPIPPMLEDGLRELTAGRDGGEPLLVSPRGNMWGESNWRNRVWRPAARAAGLDRVEGGRTGPRRGADRPFPAAYVRVHGHRRRRGREDAAEGHGPQLRVDHAGRLRRPVAGPSRRRGRRHRAGRLQGRFRGDDRAGRGGLRRENGGMTPFWPE